MKLYSKLISLFAAACLVTFSGCLKDKDYDNGVNQSLRNRGDVNIVSLGITTASVDNHLVYIFDDIDRDTIINLVPVQVAATNGATEDVKVTLSLNPALVGNYNGLNGTSHDTMPTSLYTIQNPGDGAGGYVVTIPRGSNTGYLTAKVRPHAFIGLDYALGFQITQAPSGYLISSNLGSGVVGIGIKNKWDGVYTIDESSSLVDGINPAFNSVPGDPYPYDVNLITVTANSVVMNITGTGNYHLIPGNSVYGEFGPILTFDASDNIVSVTNYYGDPSPSRARSAAIDPTGINKYNADKSIDVKYQMFQGGSLRTVFTEHLVYKKSR